MTEPNFSENERVNKMHVDPGPMLLGGTVTKVYLFEGRYRYVVTFDDGTEGVFFDFELLPA
jgi:hypothetical protein